MLTRSPLNFRKWIDEHREYFKPPVGNKLVWTDSDFMIMVVGSNTRKDYHFNEGEEFFYQVEGDITLRVIDDGKIVDIPIKQGDIYLLPPRVPHSPQRPPNTVGLVIEKKRLPGQLDGFQWYCESCGNKLYEEFVVLTNIVTQLPPIFANFYGDEAKRKCKCGARFPDPVKAG